MEQIRIFLVDDEPMAIRHIKRVLGEEQETYQIVGTAENGRFSRNWKPAARI